MKVSKIHVATDNQALSMLQSIPQGTDERSLPLPMRGGLMGVYGFGPNPARQHLNRIEGSDEQR